MTVYTLGRHVVIPQMGLRVNAARGTAAAAPASWYDVAGVTCIGAWQPKGAASYAASLVNLANPGTYNAAEGTAPDWGASTGWTFDGANTEYLTLAGLPYVALDWTLALRLVCAANTQVLFSALDNSEAVAVTVSSRSSSRLEFRVGGSGWFQHSAGAPYDGVLVVAGVQSYWDGAADTAATGASAITAVRAAFGGHWPGYGPYDPFTGQILAAAIYSSVLNATQAGNLSTAMAAL